MEGLNKGYPNFPIILEYSQNEWSDLDATLKGQLVKSRSVYTILISFLHRLKGIENIDL
jgi:hypothetical protein